MLQLELDSRVLAPQPCHNGFYARSSRLNDLSHTWSYYAFAMSIPM